MIKLGVYIYTNVEKFIYTHMPTYTLLQIT